MAIERAGYDEPEPMDDSTEDSAEEETIDIPVSMLGGQSVKPGDVVRLEVVTTNDDSGSITVKYSMPRKSGGIAEAVSKFEE